MKPQPEEGKASEKKSVFSKKELELLKEVAYMSFLWATSLIDAHVPNGKVDLITARRAVKLINKKLTKLNTHV